jgi:hypothetical protein
LKEGDVQLVLLLVVVLLTACSEGNYSSSAGVCDTVDLTLASEIDVEDIGDMEEGCYDLSSALSSVLLDETICGSQNGVTCVEGSGNRHDYAAVVFQTEETWSHFLQLFESDCELAQARIDWNSSRVVVAGFDATEVAELNASYEVFNHPDGAYHMKIEFDWVHEDCDCFGVTGIGVILTTDVDPTICIEVDGEDNVR